MSKKGSPSPRGEVEHNPSTLWRILLCFQVRNMQRSILAVGPYTFFLGAGFFFATGFFAEAGFAFLATICVILSSFDLVI
jgi:hypothetical protein